MPSITVNSPEEAQKLIETFIATFIEEYALAIKWNAKINLAVQNSFFSGDLMSSIRTEKTAEGYNVIAGNEKVKYAIYIEYGTFPHWAPIAPLKKWAKVKLGDESAAYAVQQKIAKEGTTAKPYMEPAVEGAYDVAIEKAMAKVGL